MSQIDIQRIIRDRLKHYREVKDAAIKERNPTKMMLAESEPHDAKEMYKELERLDRRSNRSREKFNEDVKNRQLQDMKDKGLTDQQILKEKLKKKAEERKKLEDWIMK